MTTDPSLSDVRTVRRCPPVLQTFNQVGLLEPVDIHVAGTLARLSTNVGGQVDDEALLGLALAVRAPRLGHACVDLATVAGVAAAEDDRAGDVADLPWPNDPAGWVAALRRTGLAHEAGDMGHDAADLSADDAPVRLVGTRVYLDRHLRDERAVGHRLADLAAVDAPVAEPDRVEAVLTGLFGPDADGDRQRAACAASATGRLTVVAGGPGTGKTYTVTRLVAMHAELARLGGRPLPRVALVAPTGKAAARVEESVHQGAAGLEVHPEVQAQLQQLSASTIHRLLGRAVGSQVRPRHDAQNPLEVDLVVVDETSMVPLSLMARLLAALPGSARLVLVGDPDQLESVEAGTVLGDVIGRGVDDRARPPLADRVVTLTQARRFGAASDIARLATAVRAGNEDTVASLLGDGGLEDVEWLHTDPESDDAAEDAVRRLVTEAGTRVLDAAADGDTAAAAAAAARLQVLCAHRRGPAGVGAWTARIERWLAAARPRADLRPEVPGSWYAGRPVLLTRNDDRRQLYNGDSGVVVYRGTDGDDPAPVVAFADATGTREIAASRLGDVETAWAITIHKSQGSQYDHVVIVLPDAASRLLTRELMYTALTRARSRVTVIGSEEALRAGVRRRVERIGGLRDLLWSSDAGAAA